MKSNSILKHLYLLSLLFTLCALNGCVNAERQVNSKTRLISEITAANSSTNEYIHSDKDRKIQKLIDSKDFIGIFENALEIGEMQTEQNYIVSAPVKKYLEKHCRTKDEIIDLMKENGFEVFNGNNKKSKSKRNEGKAFDETIYGERKATLIHLYRYRTYKIVIFLEKGAVNGVVANVGSDGL